MKQPDQQIRRRHRRPDQLQILDRIEQDIGTIPILGIVAVQNILGLQEPTIARSAVIGARHGVEAEVEVGVGSQIEERGVTQQERGVAPRGTGEGDGVIRIGDLQGQCIARRPEPGQLPEKV